MTSNVRITDAGSILGSRGSHQKRLSFRSLLMIGVLAAPEAAFAQETAIEEGSIVVTAQRREQKVQDVGVAISALGADQLKDIGITDTKRISLGAPGVLFDSTASGDVNAQLVIRGVSQSDYTAVQESPNSIYIDDVYLATSTSAAFPLYDMQRVEVLRGPQGTLFGRASSGGLVNFITAKPTSHFEGYAQAEYGSFNSWAIEGAVSGPISDRVRFRLSGRREKADGWWKNEMPGGKDTFETDYYGLRAQIEADITDSLTARASITYDRRPKSLSGTYRPVPFYIDANGSPAPVPVNVDVYGTGVPGTDAFGYRFNGKKGGRGQFNNLGFLKNEKVSPTLTLTWDVAPNTTITSITNYTHFKFDYNEDSDGTPIDIAQYPFSDKVRQYSEEARINGRSGGLTYTAGFYYLNVHQNAPQAFFLPAYRSTDFAFDAGNDVIMDLESYALFGQLEYALSDVFSLTAGARWTHDKRELSSQAFFFTLGNGYSGGTGVNVYNPPLVVYDFRKQTVGSLATPSNDLYSGKVQLDFRPNKDTLLYASISRGVKGGGFNLNVAGGLTVAETNFKPEHLWAYEAGSKLTLLDRRLILNLSTFYYDYHDFQGYAFTGVQGTVANYDGRFYGGEAMITAKPVPGTEINLGVSHVNTKLYDVSTAYFGIRDAQAVNAPKWTVNGSVSQTFDLPGGELRFVWSGNYIGDKYASIENSPSTFVKGSFLHNLRVSYDIEKAGLELAFFVNNVSNVARKNFVFDLIATSGDVVESYDKPRWFGGSIRKSF